MRCICATLYLSQHDITSCYDGQVCYKRHISCTLRRCLLLMCSHGAVNHADSGAHPIDLRSRVVSQHWLRSDGASQWDDITYHLYACSDRKSTRLHSSHSCASRMPSSA